MDTFSPSLGTTHVNLLMYLEICIEMSKKLTNSRFIHLSTEPMPVGSDYPDIIEWPENSTETIVTPHIIGGPYTPDYDV